MERTVSDAGDHGVLVNITEKQILNFFSRMSKGSVDVDLSKPLRCQHFSVLQEILKNPLQEWVSSTYPRINKDIISFPYYLYLFDGRFPQYATDGIEWRTNNKMSVKLIIYNQNTGSFKLKNNKNDEGEGMTFI